MVLSRLSLLFILFFAGANVQAQHQLIFKNADSSKTIVIKQKDLVKLSYNGYLQQPQTTEGIVTTLNDSIITLTPRKKFLQKQKPAQSLYVKDIAGFRRYSKFRVPGEIIYSVVGIGITGTITAIISQASVPAAVSFLSAAATQTLTTGLKNVFFSTKIKNHLNKGWTMQLTTIQPYK